MGMDGGSGSLEFSEIRDHVQDQALAAQVAAL